MCSAVSLLLVFQGRRHQCDLSGFNRTTLIFRKKKTIMSGFKLIINDSTWLKAVQAVITIDEFYMYIFIITIMFLWFITVVIIITVAIQPPHAYKSTRAQLLAVQRKNRFVSSLSLTRNTCTWIATCTRNKGGSRGVHRVHLHPPSGKHKWMIYCNTCTITRGINCRCANLWCRTPNIQYRNAFFISS